MRHTKSTPCSRRTALRGNPVGRAIILSATMLLALCAGSNSANGADVYSWTNFVGQPGGSGSADGTGSAAGFNNPQSVATDSAGNIYVADYYNCTIRKVTPAGVVTTLAGLAGSAGSTDGTGAAARFYYPQGVAADGAGNVYVADTYNHTIRKITSARAVTTLAGLAGTPGSADGTGSAATFDYPSGVAVDSAGNVYVADNGNSTIRKVTWDGANWVVTTLAGLPGATGSADGTGSAARFYYPCGLAVDSAGSNIYVADTYNHTIRKITWDGTNWVVTTLAGVAGSPGIADGTGSAAKFNTPFGVTVNSAGNVYVADTYNHTIRQVTSAGVVTTLAGSAGSHGSTNGTGSAARFYYPCGVAVTGSTTVYVADTYNYTIRKIVISSKAVTTLAGMVASHGSADGTGTGAQFYSPYGVVADSAGNVYVADTYNHTIRKATSAGVVTTLAGLAGSYGSADGTGNAARFYCPAGLAVDSSGNVYVADMYNHTIRQVTPSGVVSTLAGLAGISGSTDGTVDTARFYDPYSLAVDGSGNVYVADYYNCTIRKIAWNGASWVVTTLAGLARSSGSIDATGSDARFSSPQGVAVDSAGNVYVADTYNHTIRKITPSGVVTTLAGQAGSSGNVDGTGSAARFYYPTGLAVDSGDNLYVADEGNCSIRKVMPSGIVTTIGGTPGSPGGTPSDANTGSFSYPMGIAVDAAGNLYVADSNNNRISKAVPVVVYHAPTVSLDPAPAYIYEGSTVTLSATANDLDAGQALTAAFSQTAGQPVTFGAASTPALPLPAAWTFSFTLPAGSLTSKADETLTFSLTATDNGSPALVSPAATVTITAYLAGDIDHDGAVILADLKLLVDAWNSVPGSPNWNPAADLDGSGSVTLSELKLLVANWNRSVN